MISLTDYLTKSVSTDINESLINPSFVTEELNLLLRSFGIPKVKVIQTQDDSFGVMPNCSVFEFIHSSLKNKVILTRSLESKLMNAGIDVFGQGTELFFLDKEKTKIILKVL